MTDTFADEPRRIYTELRKGLCPFCVVDGERVSLAPDHPESGGPYCASCNDTAWSMTKCSSLSPLLCARCEGHGETLNELEREMENCDSCGGCGLVVRGLEVSR